MSSQTSSPAKTTNETRPARRDPFDLLKQMQAELDRFWNQPRPALGSFWRTSEERKDWIPSVDVFERNGNLVVKAELPGMKKEDIDVSIDSGMLVIRGERSAEKEVEEKDYHRMERSYGSFQRSLPLPQGTTPDQISASFKDGVLEVMVPIPAQKAPETKSIKIS